MAPYKKISYSRFCKMAALTRGHFFQFRPKTFTKVFDNATIEGKCERHNQPFKARAAAFIVKGFMHPCVFCREEEFIDSKIKQTQDDYQRILNELQTRYKGREYDYSKSEESYFISNEIDSNKPRTITIACMVDNHGDFTKTRAEHLKNDGCPKCAYPQNYGKHLLKYTTLDELLSEIKRVNVLNLDLSKISLDTVGRSVQTVGCIHGWRNDVWTVTLLRGGGCRRCAMTRAHAIKQSGSEYMRLTSTNSKMVVSETDKLALRQLGARQKLVY